MRTSLILFAIAGLAAASTIVYLEPKPVLPADWKILTAAPADTMITVHIGIKSRNGEYIRSLLLEVSDPTSPKYGQYLSKDQVTELVHAEEHVVEAVRSWLQSGGVKDVQLIGNGDLMKATMPVSVAESVFGVKMVYLGHVKGTRLVRTLDQYSIPQSVYEFVEFVEGLHRLPNMRYSQKKVSVSSRRVEWPQYCGNSCGSMITPQVLIQRYNVTYKATGAGNQSVAEFQGQDLQASDLKTFQATCNLPNQPIANFIGPGVGPTGIESGLDAEYIMGVASGVPTTFWELNDYSLYNWIEAVDTAENPPLVHSVSYGNDEAQNGVAYMEKTNTVFAKMGVRGITVLFASGDQGAWGRAGTFVFHPDFPASTPYITSVGATQFPGSDITTEDCTNWSGGGFAATHPTNAPLPFSSSAQSSYLSKAKLPPSFLWNRNGNGYPTLSANGGANQPYCIFVGGAWQGVGGTSASCPVVAGMIALLNDLRLRQGKSVLGFINPLLYQSAALNTGAFDDVVKGKNSAGKLEGFEALPGWDPCSGLGNMNFGWFANHLKNLH